nr:MAG TPA: hypothetical protein [Caudoviricetes sp.]
MSSGGQKNLSKTYPLNFNLLWQLLNLQSSKQKF